jgi:hypothetical protein
LQIPFTLAKSLIKGLLRAGILWLFSLSDTTVIHNVNGLNLESRLVKPPSKDLAQSRVALRICITRQIEMSIGTLSMTLSPTLARSMLITI